MHEQILIDLWHWYVEISSEVLKKFDLFRFSYRFLRDYELVKPLVCLKLKSQWTWHVFHAIAAERLNNNNDAG